MARARRRRAARQVPENALRLGLDATAMTIAATGVIAHRLQRIVAATSAPQARPDPELTRMVVEKADAVQEGSRRVARKATRLRPGSSPEAQLGAMLALGQAWLGPFRTRVRRNARRLGGKRQG